MDKTIVLLRRKEVERRTGLSRSGIYALMDKGEFPRPVKLGPRSVAWPEHEIQEWNGNRIRERDQEVA